MPSLFLKILIGFWLICVLIAGTIVALPVLIEQQRAPNQQQLDRYKNVANHLSHSRNLIKTLAKINHKSDKFRHRQPITPTNKHDNFFVINANDQSINSHVLPHEIVFAVNHHQQQPHSFNAYINRWAIFGPVSFSNQGKTYQLYARDRRLKNHQVLTTLRDNHWLLLSIVMLVSGICCAFLAWHITRPINSLKHTAQRLSQGNLSARADAIPLSHHDEIGQLAQSFNEMADSIELMVNNQQRLLSDISHELRSPLTRLKLALAISRRQDGELAQTQRIEQEADAIDEMLRQLLALSRVKLDSHQPFMTTSINELINEIIDNATFEAQQYDKQVTSDLVEPCVIDVNQNALATALENVIRNAIKYAKNQIHITSELTPTQCIITITDDGHGVEQQYLEQIFLPLFRVSDSRNRESGGTGLGLAIANEAINRHHGKMSARNIASGGLEITITIARIQK